VRPPRTTRCCLWQPQSSSAADGGTMTPRPLPPRCATPHGCRTWKRRS
jgi:hypothetical protein